MTLISRVIPSTACVVFIFGSLLSLSKLANAGGYSFSLWGAGFNIPGNPLCAFRPELCLPDYPGTNGTQNNPRVNGEFSNQSKGNQKHQCKASSRFEATIYERRENSIQQCDEIVYDCVPRKTPRKG